MSDNDKILEQDVISLCPVCLKRIKGEKVINQGKVFLKKSCEEHGFFECLIEENVEYYTNRYEYDKPGTESKTQTEVQKGCPYDCGLCTEHKQHTCIGLIEITSACNLACPTCYANSGRQNHLEISKIEEMVDFLIEAEGGQSEIIQISGGEPTMHPDVMEILKMVKAKNVSYVMLNTNGVRIAQDEKFVQALSELGSGFEIYLQFDSLVSETYEKMRGQDLLQTKMDAIEILFKYNIPVTLVTTVERAVNDDQLGAIFEFGVNKLGVRGINFQPVSYFGRCREVNIRDRVTLTGVLNLLAKQTNSMMKVSDFIPLPCNVERVAISYLYREKNGFVPITRKVDFRKYLPVIKNTFNFNANEMLNDAIKNPAVFGCSCMDFLKNIRPLIPRGFSRKSNQEKSQFINENVFRVSVASFVDAYNFDIKSAQKECVHVVTPDLKRIPFSMYNLLYRDK